MVELAQITSRTPNEQIMDIQMDEKLVSIRELMLFACAALMLVAALAPITSPDVNEQIRTIMPIEELPTVVTKSA